MRITRATINIDKDIITLYESFGNYFEFDMNEYKTLPKWAYEEFSKLHFVRQIGDCIFYE